MFLEARDPSSTLEIHMSCARNGSTLPVLYLRSYLKAKKDPKASLLARFAARFGHLENVADLRAALGEYRTILQFVSAPSMVESPGASRTLRLTKWKAPRTSASTSSSQFSTSLEMGTILTLRYWSSYKIKVNAAAPGSAKQKKLMENVRPMRRLIPCPPASDTLPSE